MKEFGSDFHLIESFNSGRAHLTDVFRGAVLLADGRQCVVALIRQYGWRRIWMPDYFCYSVIDTIKKQTGVEVAFYEDNPLSECDVQRLPFEEGDVLLRMNYFGIRNLRSNKDIPVPVIEDHSHDLFGHWALYSDADWCFSSLRKTLPIPEGGMMWSPKGHQLTVSIQCSKENEEMMAIRWDAMELKAQYLTGANVNKDEFRKKYVDTEEWFDHAEPVLIDKRSKEFVTKQFDMNMWIRAKRQNWKLLKELVCQKGCEVLTAENDSCNVFSFVLLFDNKAKRDSIRKKLIENSVYPAILWNVQGSATASSRDFGERMLSVHCDGRYTEHDVRQMADILNKTITDK